MSTTYVNGIALPQPIVWVSFVAYGDSSNPANFVIVDLPFWEIANG